MKYLLGFNESLDSDAFNARLVIDFLQHEYNFSFRTIADDNLHQMWVYTYLNRPIGIKVCNVKKSDSLSGLVSWLNQKRYIVVFFLDLDIDNVSDVYQKSKLNKLGKEDGIYIQLTDRDDIEDISEDVFAVISQLKDFVDDND